MNKIVILDTNFWVSNTGKIEEIISLIEEKGNLVYVPKIVQEEYINIQLMSRLLRCYVVNNA